MNDQVNASHLQQARAAVQGAALRLELERHEKDRLKLVGAAQAKLEDKAWYPAGKGDPPQEPSLFSGMPPSKTLRFNPPKPKPGKVISRVPPHGIPAYGPYGLAPPPAPKRKAQQRSTTPSRTPSTASSIRKAETPATAPPIYNEQIYEERKRFNREKRWEAICRLTGVLGEREYPYSEREYLWRKIGSGPQTTTHQYTSLYSYRSSHTCVLILLCTTHTEHSRDYARTRPKSAPRLRGPILGETAAEPMTDGEVEVLYSFVVSRLGGRGPIPAQVH
jgi:hypothetical protein